jgi:outer membrane protein assembly factor BamB
MKRSSIILLPRIISSFLVICLLLSAKSHAADWSQFRGPGGLGASQETGVPTSWSAEKNVKWRAALPGPGTSSPIVVGNRVYLTSYSGYAEQVELPGQMGNLKRHLVAIQRDTGEVLWVRDFKPVLPESTYSGGNNARHGYSSSTPISDGKRLYVFFGKSGVYCLDLEGKEIWNTRVGDNTRGWGSSNSPLLHENLVIINASIESGALVALDKQTGKEVWRTGGIRGSWNTPLLAKTGAGKTELVVSVPEKILGFDPVTGKQLWNCVGIPDRGYICPSVVADKGIVYAIGGRKNTALAVRTGGRGDVTQSHRLWVADKGSNVSSPVYHDGHIYWIHERNGVANCLDAATGEVKYQARLEPRPGLVYSSVIVADGKLYCVSMYSGTYVISASPEFKLLSHNVFADDKSRTNACPAVHNGQLLLRTDRFLYCLGE